MFEAANNPHGRAVQPARSDTVPPGTYNSSHLTYGACFTGTGSLVASGYSSWASANGPA